MPSNLSEKVSKHSVFSRSGRRCSLTKGVAMTGPGILKILFALGSGSGVFCRRCA